MCGIIGCILDEGESAPLLHQALKRLEYRGYDSAGIATVSGNKIYLKKDAGTIDEINKKVKFDDLPGSLGIAHTRWATHGAPFKENAHPHVDCKKSIAIVHNGVIENFVELKKELIDKGHNFVSKTDTEIIAHLIEEEMKKYDDLYSSVLNALRRVEGSYALAVLSAKESTKLICARKESPLIIGITKNKCFCASDISAILPFTKNILSLQNGEIAILEQGRYEIKKISDNTIIERKPKIIEWSLEEAEKQGYPHFMLKEIHEQSISLKNALRVQESYLDLISTFLDRGKEIFLVAAGTSYYACLAGSYMFSKLARLTTYPVIASEFTDAYGDTVSIDSIVLAVSQSGETYDVLKAVDTARMRAATVLGLTNTIGSTLTRVSRAYLIQQSGQEVGVAATKTFTAQVMVLAKLALSLARLRGKLSQDEIDEFKLDLKRIPDIIDLIIQQNNKKILQLAKKYAHEKLFLFLGKGISSATAFEGRLKLLEITYIPSLSYPAGESKHGPISIVEEGLPVILICPKDRTRKEILGNIMEMKARGAKIIVLCEEDDEEVIHLSDDHIGIPKGITESLSPIPYIIPLQLFSYYLAVEKRLNPDKPRNLAKTVTVP